MQESFKEYIHHCQMQGLDERVITMISEGLRGQKYSDKNFLRQEFRELELLDEVTKLRYLDELPKSVDGTTRNSLLHSF